MDIKEWQEAQRPEEARLTRYEEACKQVAPGYLSAHDVCRLFANRPYRDWAEVPGQTAKALVADLGLPLFEGGQGRWMVAHTIEGLST